MKIILVVFLCLPLSALAEATHTWVFPWVSNRADEWSGRMLISNGSSEEASINLQAIRADGSSETVTRTIGSGGSLALNAGETFPTLGSGLGYSVLMTSSEPNLRGTVIVSSVATASGNSPSAGSALASGDAHTDLLYNYLPNGPDDTAAAVVFNMGEQAALVRFSVYSGNTLLGSSEQMVPARTPLALLARDLVPAAEGNLTVTARAESPLLGASFVFNSQGEPSMVPAEADIWLPKFEPLVEGDFYTPNPAKESLGKALFFDKLLSGNRNIGCVTCHHPLAALGDGWALPVGAGGTGLGVARAPGDSADGGIHERVPRNAPHIFALGASSFTTMFADGRVTVDETQPSGFFSPAGNDLPSGLDNVLAAQAMFPVTSNAEMLGLPGENELADAATNTELWAGLVTRLMAVEEYQTMFAAAYPELTIPDDVGFEHAANAIAAFEAIAWRAWNSPFDQYTRGDKSAMSQAATRGMSLFYGEAGCGTCHSGVLQTDNLFYSTAMIPAGPGKGHGFDEHDDFGREAVTADSADRYKFRTPSLRNITTTAPYGHSGAYDSLEGVVDHMLNPPAAFAAYDKAELRVPHRADLDALDWIAYDDPDTVNAIIASNEVEPVSLSSAQRSDLIEFLRALTDPAMLDLRRDVPLSVPSGLPIAD